MANAAEVKTHRGPAVYRCAAETEPVQCPDLAKCDIYFIRMEADVRPIKIGKSFATGKRFRILQSSSPFPLTCLGLLYGEAAFESEWHRRFDAIRMSGEWFRPEPELLEAIEVALEHGSRKALGLPEPADWRIAAGLAPLKSG